MSTIMDLLNINVRFLAAPFRDLDLAMTLANMLNRGTAAFCQQLNKALTSDQRCPERLTFAETWVGLL